MDEKQIKAEIKRLAKIFANIDEDKRDLCEQLVQNAAFMAVSLRDLQEQIKIDGWVEDYQNGANQKGRKTGSAAVLYTKLINNYRQTVGDLCKLLPKGEQELARMTSDPMANFLDE
jgi:hypothetical protein